MREIVLQVPKNQITVTFIIILPFSLVQLRFFLFHIEIEGTCGWIIGGPQSMLGACPRPSPPLPMPMNQQNSEAMFNFVILTIFRSCIQKMWKVCMNLEHKEVASSNIRYVSYINWTSNVNTSVDFCVNF